MVGYEYILAYGFELLFHCHQLLQRNIQGIGNSQQGANSWINLTGLNFPDLAVGDIRPVSKLPGC